MHTHSVISILINPPSAKMLQILSCDLLFKMIDNQRSHLQKVLLTWVGDVAYNIAILFLLLTIFSEYLYVFVSLTIS